MMKLLIIALLKCTLLFSVLAVNVFAQEEEGVITLSSTVTGNQEQPKVLYILPWKQAEDHTILDLRFESKMNQVFRHVERSEHMRKLEFIDVIDGDKQ